MRILLTTVCVASTAGAAIGQSALGDGRGLQRQLHTTRDQIVGPSRSERFQQELAFRDSIVTGNAGGGFAFRGDPGYSSRFGFRGQTAEDDLYAFQRDSLTSALAPSGLRGVDALQYQFSLATGGGARSPLEGLPVLARAGDATGAAPKSLSTYASSRLLVAGSDLARVRPEDRVSDQREWNAQGLTLTPMPTNMRSVSGMQSSRELDSGFLRYADRGVGATPLEYRASPLVGVRGREMPEAAPRPGAAPSTAVSASRPPSTFYDDAMRRFRESATPASTTTAAPGQPAPPTPEQAAEAQIETLRALMADGAAEPPAEVGSVIERLRNPESVSSLLLPPDAAAGFDPFREHMQAGQTLLATQRYFEAEERFVSALAVNPGDVSALTGRIHAQLGAGLLRSAGINLRDLLKNNPEMIGTRYAGSALPPPERLGTILEMAKAQFGNDALADDAALLAAYIGYQLDRTDVVRDALSRLGGEGSTVSARAVDVLRSFWLNDPER